MDKKPELFINIIDSPKPLEIYRGVSEGELLKRALRLNNVRCGAKIAIDLGMFHRGIYSAFEKELSAENKITPILHLSCHGNTSGVQLSCGEPVPWAKLKDMITPINEAFGNLLILSMSSCEGFSACKMAMDMKPEIPFFAVIGNKGKPRWSDTLVAYLAFYHRLSSGDDVRSAVNAMKAASGNNDFEIISATNIQKSYMSAILELKWNEMLGKLKAAQPTPAL